MGKILEAVESYLAKEGWNHQKAQGQDLLEMRVKGANATYRVLVQALEDRDQVVAYVICPNNVPEDKRVAAAEFLARANFQILIGSLELDFSDGEVRCKVAMDIEGGTLSHAMVGNMLAFGIRSMDRFFPGLMSVLFANQTPADAFQAALKG